jgi:hypothetical protein
LFFPVPPIYPPGLRLLPNSFNGLLLVKHQFNIQGAAVVLVISFWNLSAKSILLLLRRTSLFSLALIKPFNFSTSIWLRSTFAL